MSPEGEGLRPGSPDRDSRPALTGRESQVLRRLVEGSTNKEIAGDLGITSKTVEFHVTKLLRKHAVASRFELADAITSPDREDPGSASCDFEAHLPSRPGRLARQRTWPRGPRAGAACRWPPPSFGNVSRVILKPGHGFVHLAQHPDLVTPMLALGGSGLFLGAVTAPLLSPSATMTARIAVLVAALIVALAGWLLVAGPVYIISRSLRGPGTVAAVLSVTGFALLPTALRVGLRGVGILLHGSATTDPGAMMSAHVSWPTWTRALLSILNVFNLWTAVLMFLAVCTVLGLAGRRSILTCVPLALFSLAVPWGLLALAAPI